ncbi:hypothetical protein sos41_37670 [Alphaproteobacteria bacterium SO-S41]|nr:hypothetical protein sos41_37670 [Alphaproteobacteria bacterium SO-S41]
MRLKLSALFLSTALATGLGLGAAVILTPVAPVAMAQAVQPGEVDVDALLKLVPPNVKASYESKSYDAISGVTTVTNLKFADPANETANYFQIAELGLRGVDMAAFAYVFDFAKYGATPEETFKPLFGDISVKGVTIFMNGAQAGTVESLAFGGVQMKQLQVKPPGTGGAPATDADNIKFLGAVLDSVIAGPFEVNNVSVDANGSKFSLKHIALEGFTRGQYGKSSLEALEASSMGNTTKMASASADGGDISRVLPWMVKAELPPVAPEGLLSIGGGSVNGLDYDIMGTKVTIASYTIDPISFYWLVPSALKVALTDMVIVPNPSESKELQDIGISQLDLDFGLDWAFDGTNVQLKELKIAESHLADTLLSLDLTGIDLAQLIDPNAMQMAAMQIGLKQAQLYLKNNGGFEKVLELAAKEENSTPDAERQKMLDQLTALEGGVPGPDGQPKPLSERMKSIVAALKSFISSPGTLTVKVQPASPITAMSGMGAAMDPMGAADLFGVTVEATPQ